MTPPLRVALLHQASPPPSFGGATKPMKPGGYLDSCADIAFALRSVGVRAICPVPDPDPSLDAQWSFPDTHEGIRAAIMAGATCIWANTVLYVGHPLGQQEWGDVAVVGQPLAVAGTYDDKLVTGMLLAQHGIPVPVARAVGRTGPEPAGGWTFPLVVKPIRGRGSDGVVVVTNEVELSTALRTGLARDARVLVEPFLPGREITIAVLPPGVRRPDGVRDPALPAIIRGGHVGEVMPYSGIVPVIHNSHRVGAGDPDETAIRRACREAETIATVLGATATIRVDARADAAGVYRAFDINLKPNITGAGRPGRGGQDSLVAMAWAAAGGDYPGLVHALAEAAVPITSITR